jgi:transposase InsO family protein
VLIDNGKQFTGRSIKPRPGEVLFERICRENGIVARNTKPRSPITTGKVERSIRPCDVLKHVLPGRDQPYSAE